MSVLSLTAPCDAGIGRANDLESMLKLASRTDSAQRWRRATTLVVDEVCAVTESLQLPVMSR